MKVLTILMFFMWQYCSEHMKNNNINFYHETPTGFHKNITSFKDNFGPNFVFQAVLLAYFSLTLLKIIINLLLFITVSIHSISPYWPFRKWTNDSVSQKPHFGECKEFSEIIGGFYATYVLRDLVCLWIHLMNKIKISEVKIVNLFTSQSSKELHKNEQSLNIWWF